MKKYGSKSMYGYDQGDMKAHVDGYQMPEGAYSEKFNDSTLDYVARNDKMCKEQGSDLRSQSFKGRYN